LVYSIMKGNVNVLTNWAQSLKFPSNNVCFFNFTASHDGIGMRPLQNIISDDEIGQLASRAEKHGGLVGYKNNEDGTQSPYELNCNYMDLLGNPNENDEIRVAKMMLTQSLMLAFPGVPGIYIHSFVGSRNYYKGIEESGIKRRINREKLEYTKLVLELNETDNLRNKVFSAYKKLLEARMQEQAFNPFGKAEYFKFEDDKVFVIKRSFKKETVYGIYNFSNQFVKMNSLEMEVVDLLSKEEVKNSFWNIDPYQFLWYKKIAN